MFPREYDFLLLFMRDVKKHADPKAFSVSATSAIPRIAKKSKQTQPISPPKTTTRPQSSTVSEVRNDRIRAQNTEKKKNMSFVTLIY